MGTPCDLGQEEQGDRSQPEDTFLFLLCQQALGVVCKDADKIKIQSFN